MDLPKISLANSRQNIRKLVKNGLVIRKPNVIHSRSRVNRRLDAKERVATPVTVKKGTTEARMPQKSYGSVVHVYFVVCCVNTVNQIKLINIVPRTIHASKR